MRPLLLLPFLCLFALSPAIAGQQDDGVDNEDVVADANAVDAEAEAAAVDGPRSGFGQVMSVLTGLLQDAAQREATGRGDGFALDNPAIEISVTPVAGHDSLLRAPMERRPVREGRRTARERLAGGTPR